MPLRAVGTALGSCPASSCRLLNRTTFLRHRRTHGKPPPCKSTDRTELGTPVAQRRPQHPASSPGSSSSSLESSSDLSDDGLRSGGWQPAQQQEQHTQQHQRPSSSGSLVAALLRPVRPLLQRHPSDAAIFALAAPAVLALAADPLLSIVDTAFVGKMGDADALAALGVNSALFTFAFIVFNFLGTATTPLVASSLAQGDRQRAGKVTVQAMLIAGTLGTTLAGALILGSDAALSLMGAGPDTGSLHQLSSSFLVIRALAAPAVLVMTVGQGAFRGMQDMRTPLAITLAANAINLGLDVALILGLGWGVAGAATATTTAEWVAAGSYLFLLWRRREALGGLEPRAALGSGAAADAAHEFLPFLAAGGAVLLRTGLLLGTKTLASATAARLGTVPIAAHQVVMQLWLLFSLLMDSLAVAGQSLVAVHVGQGHPGQARSVANRLLQLGVGAGAALALVAFVAEPLIPAAFSPDADVHAAVLAVLPIAVAMMPANAAVYVLDGVFVGASDFRWMAWAMSLAAGSGAGLLLLVQPLGLGLPGVWQALAVLQLSRLGTLLWRYQLPGGPLPPAQDGGGSASCGTTASSEASADGGETQDEQQLKQH